MMRTSQSGHQRRSMERPASAAVLAVRTIGKRGGAMPFEFSVSDFIPARAQDIYDAWLSSNGHEKITGGQKAQISAQEGAAFTVWNGYITGRNLTLEPGRRIVQSWRTTKFTDADSQIEVVLQPATGGTTVTVRHSNVPDGHTSYRDGGWQRSYFEPMKQHFKRAG
jgi:activator of HSP90 ATPase